MAKTSRYKDAAGERELAVLKPEGVLCLLERPCSAWWEIIISH